MESNSIANENDYKITDAVISGLKRFSLLTVDENESIEFIHEKCRELLELSQRKNSSDEVAIAIDLNTMCRLNPAFGDSHSVDIDDLIRQMKKTDHLFAVIHNHPGGMHFSVRDIKTFADAENIAILIALGNNGTVFAIEKTKAISVKEMLSVRKTIIDWKNGAISFENAMVQLRSFGIIYEEK